MREQQQESNSTWLLLAGILWVVILSDVIAYHPPTVRPDSHSEITYEICSLALGLFALVVIGFFARQPNTFQENLQITFSAFSPVERGFVFVVFAATMKSAFALILWLPFFDGVSLGMVGVIVDTIIFLLKWVGLGLLAWARLRSFYRGSQPETDSKKLERKIVLGLIILLVLVIFAILLWSDVNGLTSWF